MNDVLDRLSRVDLDSAVKNLLGFLDNADPCFLGLVVGILVFVGARVVAGQPALKSWGLRLAAACSLAYAAYLWWGGKFDAATPLWRHGLRCVSVGGIVLAISWVVLPVLSFVHRRFRLALAVFLGYGGYLILTSEDFTSDQLPTIALYSLLAAGLALVVAWIVDPIWTAVTSHLLPERPPVEKRNDEAPLPVSVRPAFMPQAMLGRVEESQESQRRRDRARMQVELAYLQAMPGIATWMPRHLFDDFLRRHLADTLPPEDVEENARRLLLVFQQHLEQVHERSEFTSFEELANWLLTEQQRIQATSLDQQLKQSQLLDLHQRYLLLATRMVQKQGTHGLTTA